MPTTDNAPPLLLDVRQAAKLLGVGLSTMWGLINDGEVPAVRPRPRLTRVRPADLQNYIDNLPTYRPTARGDSDDGAQADPNG